MGDFPEEVRYGLYLWGWVGTYDMMEHEIDSLDHETHMRHTWDTWAHETHMRQEQQEYVCRRTTCMNVGHIERLLSTGSSTHEKELKFSGFLCSFFFKNKSLTVWAYVTQTIAAMDELHYTERHQCPSNIIGHWKAGKCQGWAPVARLLGNQIFLKYCDRSCSGNSSSILQLFAT